MKSIHAVVTIIVLGSLSVAFAEDKRDRQLKELEQIKTQLKPLREKAYLEPDVIAARQKLDAAYKEYWYAVRGAMIRLDPSQKTLIEKDIKLRKTIAPISAGSRAGDYEKKAAESPTPAKKAK